MRTVFVISLLIVSGCSNSPDVRVDKTEAEINRALANSVKLIADIDKQVSDIEKSAKLLDVQRASLIELKAKLKNLLPTPSPTPNPGPAPSPAPAPSPGPKPDPLPGPAPTPTEPVDGRFAIAKRIYHMALAIKTDDLSAEAAQLAANFRAVADLVKQGKTDSLMATKQAYNISVELTKLNKPITKSHVAWLPPAEQLGALIGGFFDDGRLASNADWCDCLNEVGDALEAVSKASRK